MAKGSTRSQFRLILMIIVGALAVILAFQNRESVVTHFLMFQVTMPRFLLLLVTAGLGFLAGYLAGAHKN